MKEQSDTLLKERAMRIRAENMIGDLHALTERQTRQILAIQDELGNFSYAVSHDLRAPLRAIDGFSKALDKKLKGKLAPEEQRYLQIVLDSARKMGRLIDDLLAYHRIGRKDMKMVNVDVEALIYTVFQELTRDFGALDRIDLKVGAMPEARADRAMIKDVVYHLLQNAIKFSDMRKKIVIEVGGEQQKQTNVYYIRDYGAGFDMEYVDKVFGMFQRLCAEDEFEGNGVGLAIAQRIIHLHEGDIWADAVPDQGSTFYFSLPLIL